MAFIPIEGYSEKRTSTVFQDGETKQRAEFNYNLSNEDWTPISYDENRATVLVQNGDIKQRATVVYNIGESSGGGTVSGLTSVSHDSTLTGNGTPTSPLGVGSTITGDINTLKNDVQTLDSDTAASTYATQSSLTSGLATKANTTDVYTKSDVDSKLGGKVNIAQGADNAGKVLGIDNSGNVTPTTIQAEQANNIVWDKSADLPENSQAGTYHPIFTIGTLATGHYKLYVKVMNSTGLVNSTEELLEPYTSVIDFYYNATDNTALGNISPVLDTNTILNNNQGIPTSENTISVDLVKNTDGSLAIVGNTQYVYTELNLTQGVTKAFEASKLVNVDTNVETSITSISYNTTGDYPEGYSMVSVFHNGGIDILSAERPTKKIVHSTDASINGVLIGRNGTYAINPTQTTQYGIINDSDTMFGRMLCCIMEQNITSLAYSGDMLLVEVLLTPSKVEYKRISATGKFANYKPFIEKLETDEYCSLTLRNYDWSSISLGSGNQWTIATSFYGVDTNVFPNITTLTTSYTPTETYEVPVEEKPNTGVAVLLYYDSTQASDHSHAYNDVSLVGYDLVGYEVYSNGYVRQWGQDSNASGATLVTLPISYNAASTVSMSFFVSVTEVAAEATGSISAIPVAANQFQVDKPSAVCNWETTGYITL